MTWTLMWFNWSVTIINATFQFLDILVVDPCVACDNFFRVISYIYIYIFYYYYCFTIVYVNYVKFLYDKIIQIMLCNRIILYSL